MAEAAVAAGRAIDTANKLTNVDPHGNPVLDGRFVKLTAEMVAVLALLV